MGTIKSNIKLASNIGVRANCEIYRDGEYIKTISGYEELQKFKERYGRGLSSHVVFSNVQLEEMKQNPICSKAKNKERTHGKILSANGLQWVGRCEYKKCQRYSICDQVLKIERKLVENSEVGLNDIEFAKYDFDNNNTEIVIEELFENNYVDDQNEETQNDEVITAFINKDKFKKIKDISLIVESDINSKILVNAGPGTGKTYCLIKRIIYILKNNLVQAENLLVLCYSKSAIYVIKDRLQEAVYNGEIPINAMQISISTFDSFAAGYLYYVEGINLTSYENTISTFNKKMNKEYFTQDRFEYVIIDELQDVVDIRAEMVLKILENIECGYLLLGDKCQAIYDFHVNSEVDIKSEEFYKKLETSLKQDTLYYELIGNKRQCESLSKQSEDIREGLLTLLPNEQYEYIVGVLQDNNVKSLPIKEFLKIKIKNNTAILCRTNGEVMMLSSKLSEKKIAHTVLSGQETSKKIQRFIADIFWDYVENRISLKDFQNRYIFRVENNIEKATDIFRDLVEICSEEKRDMLYLDELKKNLKVDPDLFEDIFIQNEKLVISTIHRAKGQEFDDVYLLNKSNSCWDKTSSEARVKYVAITRPKLEFQYLEEPNDWFLRKMKSQSRFYRLTYKSKYIKWCSALEISKDSHVDTISFADKSLLCYGIGNQEYISSKINVYDEVEAVFNQEIYEIYHNNVLIGSLAQESSSQFKQIIDTIRKGGHNPIKLTGLYVSNIYTVVAHKQHENLALPFSSSGLWLGLEISGMAKTKYS